jgi:hypothetical protein
VEESIIFWQIILFLLISLFLYWLNCSIVARKNENLGEFPLLWHPDQMVIYCRREIAIRSDWDPAFFMGAATKPQSPYSALLLCQAV